MKRSILFLTGIFTSLIAAAQDYQCVKADAEYMFWDGIQYHAISIDSVQNQSGYFSYYNFPVIGGEYGNFDCLSKDWPSWIGRKIDIYTNGDNVFYNFLQEPIFIKAQAGNGETWTCYTFEDGQYIVSTVTEKVELEFLGLTDSVKKISFQAMDESGNPVSHNINNKHIWLSKNHGLFKAINFKLFPDLNDFLEYEIRENDLCGISNPPIGVQNLTMNRIFNFEVGDEFHSLVYADMWTDYSEEKMIKTLVNKEWLNDSTIVFVYKRCGRRQYIDYSIDFDTVYYFDDTINETISTAYSDYKGLNHSPEMFYAIGDTNYYEYQWFTQINNEEYGKLQKYLNDGFYSVFPHECIQVIITKEKYYEGESYLEDLGGPYWHNGEWGNEFYHGLVYYKKGIEEWGIPYNCDSLLSRVNELIGATAKVILSPNPMHSRTKISIENNEALEYHLLLYNSIGIVVREFQFQSNELVIEKENLLEGIYFFMINNGKQLITDGKLIIR
jgi:hypothetical protein